MNSKNEIVTDLHLDIGVRAVLQLAQSGESVKPSTILGR